MAQCVYSTPCGCGRSYIGETGIPLAVWICKHKHNFRGGPLGKSKLAQLTYEEEDHGVSWDEGKILEIGSNHRYRKYKESAHMACLINLIISPVWTSIPSGAPLSRMSLSTQRDCYNIIESSLVLNVLHVYFSLHRWH
jgi:hypothetical protein